MKYAIFGAAALTVALAFPAAAQRVPDTPAAGTRTASAATGFTAPNGMVNGSTSLASDGSRKVVARPNWPASATPGVALRLR